MQHLANMRARLPRVAAAIGVLALTLAGVEVFCQLEGYAMLDDPAASPADSMPETGAACSLPAVELGRRRALYAREVVPHVTGVVHDGEELRLTLDTAPAETEALARKMAALEADCCSFLTVDYAPDLGPGTIRLRAPREFLVRVLSWGFRSAGAPADNP